MGSNAANGALRNLLPDFWKAGRRCCPKGKDLKFVELQVYADDN